MVCFIWYAVCSAYSMFVYSIDYTSCNLLISCGYSHMCNPLIFYKYRHGLPSKPGPYIPPILLTGKVLYTVYHIPYTMHYLTYVCYSVYATYYIPYTIPYTMFSKNGLVTTRAAPISVKSSCAALESPPAFWSPQVTTEPSFLGCS